MALTSPPRRAARNRRVAARVERLEVDGDDERVLPQGPDGIGRAPRRCAPSPRRRPAPLETSPSRAAAEWSSRRWASSTTTSVGRGPANPRWRRTMAPSTSAGWSALTSSGRSVARAPNGIDRPASVATTALHAVAGPLDPVGDRGRERGLPDAGRSEHDGTATVDRSPCRTAASSASRPTSSMLTPRGSRGGPVLVAVDLRTGAAANPYRSRMTSGAPIRMLVGGPTSVRGAGDVSGQLQEFRPASG